MSKNEKIFEEVKLYHYAYEYNFNQLDCLGQSLAIVSSIYNKDNYHLYAFLNSLYLMWGDKFNFCEENLEFEMNANNRLQKLGLKINSHNIYNEFELVEFIKCKINEKKPIIFNPKRNLIPYCSDYGNINNNSIHSILISGYSDERNCILLKDIAHLESSGIDLKTKYGLFNLYLKFGIFIDMWNDTNKSLEKDSNLIYYKNKMFTIDKVGSTLYSFDNPQSIKNLFNTIYKNESNLVDLIKKIKMILKEDGVESIDESMLKFPVMYICNALTVFIDILDKINYDRQEIYSLDNIINEIYTNLLICSKYIIKKENPTNLDYLIEIIRKFEEMLSRAFQ